MICFKSYPDALSWPKTSNDMKVKLRAARTGMEEAEAQLAAAKLWIAGQDKTIKELQATLALQSQTITKYTTEIEEINKGYSELSKAIDTAKASFHAQKIQIKEEFSDKDFNAGYELAF